MFTDSGNLPCFANLQNSSIRSSIAYSGLYISSKYSQCLSITKWRHMDFVSCRNISAAVRYSPVASSCSIFLFSSSIRCQMVEQSQYTIPWEHSLSSDVPCNFSFCAPRLLHPAFSDGQGVPPCLYEPSPTLLGTLSSAWCLHLAAYLSGLTDTDSMPHNCFRPRNRGRAYHLCFMFFPTVGSSICMFPFRAYSKSLYGI